MMASQILLWTTVILEGVLIAALARQVGLLHERIAPAGALTLPQGVSVGEVATPMTVTTLDKALVEVGGKRKGAASCCFSPRPIARCANRCCRWCARRRGPRAAGSMW
jgi:hypothetical protein